MSERRRLPNRRPCETFEFETGGLRYVCSVGRFADGTVEEIFLTNHRVNSQAGIMASDQAMLASQALQHGASLATLSRAVMRDAQGRAMSPIGCAFDLLDMILGAQP